MAAEEELKPEQNVRLIADFKAAFDGYGNAAAEFDLSKPELGLLHAVFGLSEEAGEVAGKFKKNLRDNDGKIGDEEKLAIAKELGDVLWFIAAVARHLNIPFHVIPMLNIQKLADRRARGVERGEGDNR